MDKNDVLEYMEKLISKTEVNIHQDENGQMCIQSNMPDFVYVSVLMASYGQVLVKLLMDGIMTLDEIKDTLKSLYETIEECNRKITLASTAVESDNPDEDKNQFLS